MFIFLLGGQSTSRPGSYKVRYPVLVSEFEAAPVDLSRAYQRHRAELRNFFTHVTRGKAAYIEDLVHNVYLRLLEYPPTQALREPQAYLFKLAWSELHRFHAKSMQEPTAHDHETLERLSVHSRLSSPEDASEAAVEAVLMKVMTQLPAIYGEVFVRFKWDGRTYRQIAAELKLTPRQVKRYIARTLQCLKQARLEE